MNHAMAQASSMKMAMAAEQGIAVFYAAGQHFFHAARNGVVLPACHCQAVERAGRLRVAGHVAARYILAHEWRGQRELRVFAREAVNARAAGTEGEGCVCVVPAALRETDDAGIQGFCPAEQDIYAGHGINLLPQG